MQVTFRYTNAEYKASRRLNRLLGTPRWKSHGLAILCLLPSLLLVWISGSMIAVFAFAMMIGLLALASCWAAIRAPAYLDKHDHTITFSKTSKHEMTSHSEFETDWRNYDEFTESESSYVFRKVERFTMIPKRVIPPEQTAEFLRHASQVNDPFVDFSIPVPLFDRLFVSPSQNSIYRFVYHPQDLIDAIANPLALVNGKGPAMQSKKNRFGLIWLALLGPLALYFVFVPPRRMPWGDPWNLTQMLLVMGAIVLPLFLIRALNSWYRTRSKKNTNSVPPEENHMRLLNSGWAIGSLHSVIFYDWRDVECFYQNSSCFGFKTINELIQIVPKRIFSDPSQAQAFLEQAMALWREHRRQFEKEAAVAIETGNPYQPPAN